MAASESAVGCNVCLPMHQADLDAGRGWRFAPAQDDKLYIRLDDGTAVDYKCPQCGSRGRTRAVQTLISQARSFMPIEPRVLAVSSTRPELRILSRSGARTVNVSLQGDHGDPDCIVGIDVTDMPSIPSNAFDLYYASGVVDYIPDPLAFFQEAGRTLKDDGVLIFYVQPFRLLDDDSATVQVVHRNALRHEGYARKEDGSETGIPDCRFGTTWLVGAARSKGLAVQLYPVNDHISPLEFRWFMGRKLSTTNSPTAGHS